MHLLPAFVVVIAVSLGITFKATSTAFQPIPTPAPSPTPTLQPTQKPTPHPTIKSTPSQPVVQASSTPAPIPTPQTTTSVLNFIMSQVNDYRKSKGLSTVQTNSQTCSFAKIRASEIAQSFNHDLFQNRIDSKTLPYSSYSQVTENIAMNSNYQDVVLSWINSPGHAANIEKDTPFVCIGISGNYFAYEGWKP